MDRLRIFDTRAEALTCAAETLLGGLEHGLAENGCAIFMGSGGTTPGPVYDQMNRAEIDWQNVTVGLVDERWVIAEDAASNERLMRERLLVNAAKASRFVPMKTDGVFSDEAAQIIEAAYKSAAPSPYDSVLLGMGSDGHTASWFPGAGGLDTALDPSGEAHIVAIDASGAPVAGDHPHRVTLTLGALQSARCVVLLIFGDEKRRVLDKALRPDGHKLPVSHAIKALGNRLQIFWAQ